MTLAENKNCDIYIAQELTEAGIPIIQLDYKSTGSREEVPFTKAGKLFDLTFIRDWSYWRVHGPVSQKIAIELYNDPIGKKVIRCDGYAGGVNPDNSEAYKPCVDGFINTYHIDSEEGLVLFASTIKKKYIVNLNNKKNISKRKRLEIAGLLRDIFGPERPKGLDVLFSEENEETCKGINCVYYQEKLPLFSELHNETIMFTDICKITNLSIIEGKCDYPHLRLLQ